MLLPTTAQSANNTCMGHKVDIMGTSGNDEFVANWGDDKNNDGWTVYAGGKGDDRLLTNSVDSGTPTLILACGYAGNDYFEGGWNAIDGGSGIDTADIVDCWLGRDMPAYPVRNTERVAFSYCPEGTP